MDNSSNCINKAIIIIIINKNNNNKTMDNTENYNRSGILNAIAIANNEAAHMIVRGKYRTAFQVLQGSLKELRTSFTLLGEGAGCTQHGIDQDFHGYGIHPIKNETSDIAMDCGNSFFLQPFIISLNGFQANTLEAAFHFMSLILLFNLGITSHRQDLVMTNQHGPVSSTGLHYRRTKNLYRCTLRYVEANHDVLHTHYHHGKQLIMILCHNVAAITLHEGLLSEYNAWKDHLLMIFSTIETFLEEDIYLYFRTSISIMCSTMVVAAQAA